jgi:hypothetical protein
MTEQEVKDSLGIASRKIKDEMIPAMTNVLMDVFQYGLNAGTELGAKIVNDKFDSKTQSCIKWQTGEPKESGAYLITTYSKNVFVDYWRVFPNKCDWDYRDKFDVKAWCKLSDIKPYKE